MEDDGNSALAFSLSGVGSDSPKKSKLSKPDRSAFSSRALSLRKLSSWPSSSSLLLLSGGTAAGAGGGGGGTSWRWWLLAGAVLRCWLPERRKAPVLPLRCGCCEAGSIIGLLIRRITRPFMPALERGMMIPGGGGCGWRLPPTWPLPCPPPPPSSAAAGCDDDDWTEDEDEETPGPSGRNTVGRSFQNRSSWFRGCDCEVVVVVVAGVAPMTLTEEGEACATGRRPPYY